MCQELRLQPESFVITDTFLPELRDEALQRTVLLPREVVAGQLRQDEHDILFPAAIHRHGDGQLLLWKLHRVAPVRIHVAPDGLARFLDDLATLVLHHLLTWITVRIVKPRQRLDGQPRQLPRRHLPRQPVAASQHIDRLAGRDIRSSCHAIRQTAERQQRRRTCSVGVAAVAQLGLPHPAELLPGEGRPTGRHGRKIPVIHLSSALVSL